MRDYIVEISDYFGRCESEVSLIVEESEKRLALEWNDCGKNIEEFYKSDLFIYRMMRARPKVDECLRTIMTYSLARGDEKILDYGCGVGSYLIPLAEVGFKMTGVEVQDSAVLRFTEWRLIRRYLDVKLYGHRDFKSVDESFDAILFYDVLEHLEHPFEIVKRLHNLLKSKGILYMTFSPHGELTNLKEINDECLPFLNKQFYRLDNERWLHK